MFPSPLGRLGNTRATRRTGRSFANIELMKLRVTKNSIRMRLSQTDVQQFRETGVVDEELVIGASIGGSLTYRLARGNGSAVSANLDGTTLTVSIPAGEADDWTATDRVGIEGSQPIDNGSSLSILVEKDFACLTPRAGDEDKDTFPHPELSKNC
jgi:hypothetical protein